MIEKNGWYSRYKLWINVNMNYIFFKFTIYSKDIS